MPTNSIYEYQTKFSLILIVQKIESPSSVVRLGSTGKLRYPKERVINIPKDNILRKILNSRTKYMSLFRIIPIRFSNLARVVVIWLIIIISCPLNLIHMNSMTPSSFYRV